MNLFIYFEILKPIGAEYFFWGGNFTIELFLCTLLEFYKTSYVISYVILNMFMQCSTWKS